MFRRIVAPVLRFLAFLMILMSPLLLAAIAQAEETAAPGRSLVALRGVVLASAPGERVPRGPRLQASAPATLVEAREGRILVETGGPNGPVRGWADRTVFFTLDDPAETVDRLLGNARLLSNSNDRPVLTIAYLREVLRRDPSRLEAWELLGRTGIAIAASGKPQDDGRPPIAITLAAQWGVRVVPVAAGRTYRYDGDAFRRLIALSPPAEAAERARYELLTRCGLPVDPSATTDATLLAARERDLAEFLGSFPASTRRVPFLLERARILSALAESQARKGDVEASLASREAAIEAASEVSASAPDAPRRRTADRLIARLTKSLPRRSVSEKAVASSLGFKASFVSRGKDVVLVVTRPDGREAIQPYTVLGADPATLTFDPTGNRLVWDEAPAPGRRKTRLLDLARARLLEPAALAEPELLSGNGGGSTSASYAAADRYTSFVGFSPDGRLLLVVFEGFTPDGVRIPRRHFLCDAEGKGRPIVVERPFSSPGVVDWPRLGSLPEKLSG